VSLAQVAPVKSEAELKLERLKALDQGHDFSSRIEPVAQELGQARTFFEAKDYGTALDRYQKVISASAELQSEIAAAQERLPQPVTIVCAAGGSEVSGATVTVDGATQAEKTPLTLKLSRGQAHRVEVRLDSRGGKRYLPGTAAYTVAQTGPQTLRVDLREYTGPAEGESWVVPGLGIGFEWIRPGTFQMGSTQAERD
jgi:hypothetical protein